VPSVAFKTPLPVVLDDVTPPIAEHQMIVPTAVVYDGIAIVIPHDGFYVSSGV